MPDQNPTPDELERLREAVEMPVGAVAVTRPTLRAFLDAFDRASPSLPDSGERDGDGPIALVQRLAERECTCLVGDEALPLRCLGCQARHALAVPRRAGCDALVRRLDGLHDGLVQMGSAPQAVIDEAAALAQMAARLPSSDDGEREALTASVWFDRACAERVLVWLHHDDCPGNYGSDDSDCTCPVRALRAEVDAQDVASSSPPAGGEGDDERAAGTLRRAAGLLRDYAELREEGARPAVLALVAELDALAPVSVSPDGEGEQALTGRDADLLLTAVRVAWGRATGPTIDRVVEKLKGISDA